MNQIRSILRVGFTLAILFVVPSSIFSQKAGDTVKPGKQFKQPGVKFSSPNDSEWKLATFVPAHTVFVKDANSKKFIAFTKSFKIAVYDSPKDLFAHLEKLKIAEIDEPNRDSIHYNNTEYKSTLCLQYDGIINVPNTAYKYFNLNGYMCRHPYDKALIVQIEFSNYSNDRGYLRPEMESSKAFFEGLQFDKIQ